MKIQTKIAIARLQMHENLHKNDSYFYANIHEFL